MTLTLWSPCLYLLSAGMTDVHNHDEVNNAGNQTQDFMLCKQALPTEAYPRPNNGILEIKHNGFF